jgi:GT2 family glycosyltransferase
MVRAFDSKHRLGIVFGNVLPSSEPSELGFIPASVREDEFLAARVVDQANVDGLSACMGIRKEVWRELDGFDEMLGTGAIFQAAEETDFVIRALQGKWQVCRSPRSSVVHYGFRNRDEGLLLINRYYYGTGATFAKHFRCRRWNVARLLAVLACRWAFGHSRVTQGLGGRSYPLARLSSFIKGFVAASLTQVDRTSGLFAPLRTVGVVGSAKDGLPL